MIYPQFVLRLIGALLKLTGDSKKDTLDISALVLIDRQVTTAKTNLNAQRRFTFLISPANPKFAQRSVKFKVLSLPTV